MLSVTNKPIVLSAIYSECHKEVHSTECRGTYNISIFSPGFLTRHLDTKSMKAGLHLSGSLNDGGGFDGIMKMALIGWMSP
jgi:hypothetical protein